MSNICVKHMNEFCDDVKNTLFIFACAKKKKYTITNGNRKRSKNLNFDICHEDSTVNILSFHLTFYFHSSIIFCPSNLQQPTE